MEDSFAVTSDGEAAEIRCCLDEAQIKEESRYDGLYAVTTDLLEDDVQGYILAYTRDKLTDSLHEYAGFNTDYQFITKRKMRNIQKKSKCR